MLILQLHFAISKYLWVPNDPVWFAMDFALLPISKERVQKRALHKCELVKLAVLLSFVSLDLNQAWLFWKTNDDCVRILRSGPKDSLEWFAGCMDEGVKSGFGILPRGGAKCQSF